MRVILLHFLEDACRGAAGTYSHKPQASKQGKEGSRASGFRIRDSGNAAGRQGSV